MLKVGYTEPNGMRREFEVAIMYFSDVDDDPTAARHHTLVMLSDLATGEVVSSGAAFLFNGNDQLPPDRFSRRVGRKLAFARAIEPLFNRGERKELWADFFRQVQR